MTMMMMTCQEDLKVLTSIYAENNSSGKSIKKSLVDHQKYTKDDIIKTFNCSRYMVDKAQKLWSECVGLVIPEETKQSRINRFPIAKVEHFLDFLFFSNLMQDVAYGVNKIKFDGGDKQKVAKSILKWNVAIPLPITASFGQTPASSRSLKAHYGEFWEE